MLSDPRVHSCGHSCVTGGPVRKDTAPNRTVRHGASDVSVLEAPLNCSALDPSRFVQKREGRNMYTSLEYSDALRG